MALSYTYLKYKGEHTIENTGGVSLTYTISKVTCDTTTVIKTGVILAASTAVLNFVVDGEYTITLTDSIETESFDIKHYYNLITSYIDKVEAIICGCSKCDECQECNQCEDYLNAIMKAMAFNAVYFPLYQEAINGLFQDSICLFTDQILCNLLHEKVYGNSDFKPLLLQVLAFYYTSFYSVDVLNAADQEEQDYFTELYKFTKIAKCIRKIGITV